MLKTLLSHSNLNPLFIPLSTFYALENIENYNLEIETSTLSRGNVHVKDIDEVAITTSPGCSDHKITRVAFLLKESWISWP